MEPLSRRNFLAASASAAVAAVIPTQSAHPFITVGRNRPRRKTYRPLYTLEPHVRAEIFRRRRKADAREAWRRRLYEAAIQAQPGAVYRYLHFSWTFMHPYRDWPEFYAEQMRRAAWGYQRLERPQMRPRGKYFVLDRAAELELYHRGLLGQIIMLSGGRTSTAEDAEEGIVEGAYYLGGAGADDANDGILVAEGGDGPVATWGELSDRAVAGDYSIGDHIYLRSGDWVVTEEAKWTGGGSSANVSKITVEGYPGEVASVNVDFATNDDTSMIDGTTGTGPLNLRSANWRFKNFTFTSRQRGISTYSGDAVHGTEFVGLNRVRSGTATSGGNVATVLTFDDGSNNTEGLIENCDLSDGNEIGSGQGNGATVYVIHAPLTIRNNKIGALGDDAGQCLHFKRQLSTTTLGDTTVENNLFSRYGNYGRCIYFNNVQYGIIQHNAFSGPPGSSQAMYGIEDGQHPPDGWSWYFCDLLHNTSRADASYGSGGGLGLFNIDAPSANEDGTEVDIFDNVMDGIFNWCPGDTTLKDHNNNMDYQLYATDTDNLGREGNNTFSNLAAWQAEETRFNGSHDGNSAEEDINWDVAFDRWVAASYALDAMSAGAGAAQDMTDMGADTSLVGDIL